MTTLTNRTIEANRWPTKRLTDRGLCATKNADGTVSLSYRYVDGQGKSRAFPLGEYDRDTLDVDIARAKVKELRRDLKNEGKDPFEQREAVLAQRVTVDQVIREYIADIKTPIRKPNMGDELTPRVETWANVESHLRRFMSPDLGAKPIRDVTNRDIAKVQLALPTPSNKRHFRKAVSGLFKWAAVAGRDYVTASPCVNLPKLDKEPERDRALEDHELKALWTILDNGNKAHLAIKFALATMLRSKEMLNLRRDEVFDLDGEKPYVVIPARRVKKRRPIIQPLSPLAASIVREAMGPNDTFVFQSDVAAKPIQRTAMAVVLRGRKDKGTIGLCEQLGLQAKVTPHDLRRTASTIAGVLGYRQNEIAPCLDHEDDAAPRATRIYVRSPDFEHKRKILNDVGTGLARIVGDNVVSFAA